MKGKKLKLKVGRSYLTRGGNKVKITHKNKNEKGRLYKFIGNNSYGYTKNGYWHNYEHNKDLVSEYVEPVKRDLSGVQHLLDQLVPEVRERVIELANDPEDGCYISYPKPRYFMNIFTWCKTDEGSKYWLDIYDAFNGIHLKENNPAFIQPEVEEMTLEEVCKELGREVKIIKGE